mgnify:CR=1 FL=1
MKIKIIKKGTNSDNDNQVFFQPKKVEKKQRIDEKVTQNILGWVDELRKKKQFEIINTQAFLSGFK